VKSLSIVAVLVSLGGLLVPAHAQETKVIVTVPFEFIVGTQTLPAGKYTVSSTSSETNAPLVVFNREHSTFLLPTTFESTQFGNTSLSFHHIGDDYVLSQIATPTGTYMVDDHREVEKLIKLAQSKDHMQSSGMASSGGQ
jgi:hypothetical protein